MVQAIDYDTLAEHLTFDDYPDKSSWHNDCGISFQDRFERHGEMDDLIRAIDHHTRAVRLTPDGHLDKPERHIVKMFPFFPHFPRNPLESRTRNPCRYVFKPRKSVHQESARFRSKRESLHSYFKRFGISNYMS